MSFISAQIPYSSSICAVAVKNIFVR